MRWFRFYSEVLHDPKVQRLPVAMRWHWAEILCLASDGNPRGRLPKVRDIAFSLRVSEQKADRIVTVLLQSGLLEKEGDTLLPHNWDARQPVSDDAAQRKREQRSRDTPEPLSRDGHGQLPARLDKSRGEETRQDKSRGEEEESNIFRLYEQTIGPFDPHMATKLREAADEYSRECIGHSFAEASENNKRSWRYVEAILKAHKANGCYARRGQAEAGGGAEVLERHERQQREKVK